MNLHTYNKCKGERGETNLIPETQNERQPHLLNTDTTAQTLLNLSCFYILDILFLSSLKLATFCNTRLYYLLLVKKNTQTVA